MFTTCKLIPCSIMRALLYWVIQYCGSDGAEQGAKTGSTMEINAFL